MLARIRPPLEARDDLLTAGAIDPRVSAPLLFLIAEQSPDAREAARELGGPRLEDIHRGALVESIEDLALEKFEAILERADRQGGLRPSADAPFDERATQALYGLCWAGLVQMVCRLLDGPMIELAYLSFETPQQAFTRVVELATRAINLPEEESLDIMSSYAGPRHASNRLVCAPSLEWRAACLTEAASKSVRSAIGMANSNPFAILNQPEPQLASPRVTICEPLYYTSANVSVDTPEGPLPNPAS